jgi:predicted dithiol-disulfide oxidoreductase (DUF899 family)
MASVAPVRRKGANLMMTAECPAPPVTSREEWLRKRKELLAEEKELTHHRDRVNAMRRRLPMVRLDKTYEFEGVEGKRTLAQLFEGKHQLIVYHFMFDPEWEKGCPGCTKYINALGDRSMLGELDTRFVVISRAPLAKLQAYKAQKGWDIDWYSSYGSDFNYDFHTTLDESVRPIEYNYRSNAEWAAKEGKPLSKGEAHAESVFFREGDQVFHTYTTYGRGMEMASNAYGLLDLTPYGRQEDFEDSPEGWPQHPTYG